jgi:putative pyoverdin transport system ATP-binding/permease protein
MNFLELIKVESEAIMNRIMIYATISGLANASLLAIINAAAGSVSYNELNFRYLLMFIVALAINILTQRYLFDKSSNIIEQIVHGIRVRLTGKIRRAELVDLDAIGKAEIYNRMTQQTSEISQSAGVIIAALQSAIMVSFSVLYLATLSLWAFALTILIVVIGISIYLSKEKFIIQFIHKTNASEVKLLTSITHLLDGFKEVKLSKDRSNDLANHISSVASEVRGHRVQTERLYNWNYIFAQSFFYVLVAVMVFILPRFIEVYADSVTEIAAVILFIIGPLSTVVSGFPAYTKANIAVLDINDLEMNLDHLNGRPHLFNETVQKHIAAFNTVSLKSVEFSYYDVQKDALFKTGPIELTLKKGETLFIVGGNGSGKSTLLKLLTGLYTPEKGKIEVDNTIISPENVQEYRELFSAIFSDFHLFDRLYGIKDWSDDEIFSLIKEFQLEDKTSFKDGVFTNLNLSTGQKKRIAMIVALLENRPICVFDEWAADQDPEFRRYFYYELIPKLKQTGKTIIIVSHDDQYFNTADRIMKMDYGQLSAYS